MKLLAMIIRFRHYPKVRLLISSLKIFFTLLFHHYAFAASQELLLNGDFEDGHAHWSTYAVASGVGTSADIVDLGNARNGDWYAYVGDRSADHGNARGVLRQDVIIPANATELTLRFYLNITSDESNLAEFDKMGVYLLTADGKKTIHTFGEWSNEDKDLSGDKTNYRRKSDSVDIERYRGQKVILQFYAQTDAAVYTTFRIDDVTLIAELEEDDTYTITSSAGSGGKISPDGTLIFRKGATETFIAEADEGYEVDGWYLDGNNVQSNDNRFRLPEIDANHTIRVTFRPKTFRITTSSENGQIIIEPTLDRYPYGGVVTVRAKPNRGYTFLVWDAGLDGVSIVTQISVKGDINIIGRFIPLTTSFPLSIANSTPPVLNPPAPQESPKRPVISFGAEPGYVHTIYYSDNLRFWKPITARTVDSKQVVTWEIPERAHPVHLYKVSQTREVKIKPFLRFPVEGYTSKTCPVSSLFDHHRSFINEREEKKDGAIVTCFGQLAHIGPNTGFGYRTVKSTILEKCDDNPSGNNYYKRFSLVAYGLSEGANFDFPFTPQSKEIAFYDGHTGYDYAVGEAEDVIAVAEGEIVVDECGTPEHQLVIQHKNGLKSYYLHLSKWDSSVSDDNTSVKAVTVKAGQKIGKPGKEGNANGVHLHFELRMPNPDNQTHDLIDPYGIVASDGSIIQPSLWLDGE